MRKQIYTSPSFNLSNRIARALWNITYTLFFKFTPNFCHEWRSFLLRLFGAKIGKHCHIYPKAKIWLPKNLIMDDYSCLADGVDCYNVAKVKIGKKVIISQRTFLCTATRDLKTKQIIAKPIILKEKSWIAAEAFIGPGVTIEENTVIGARSVVTKNMPKNTFCAGNPCKIIKNI